MVSPCYPKSSRSAYVSEAKTQPLQVGWRPCSAPQDASGTAFTGTGGLLDRFVSHFNQSAGCQGSACRFLRPSGRCWRETASKGCTSTPRFMRKRWTAAATPSWRRSTHFWRPYRPIRKSGTLMRPRSTGESEVLKIDGEGRVSLTETMKAQTSITTEATFVGEGHKFQIWEPSRFRAHLEEARRRVRDHRKQLSSGHAAAPAVPQPPGARD